jgi:hypothetical protein
MPTAEESLTDADEQPNELFFRTNHQGDNYVRPNLRPLIETRLKFREYPSKTADLKLKADGIVVSTD